MRFGGEVELTADNLVEASLAVPAGLGLERLAVGGVRITSPRHELTAPLRGQVAIQRSSGIPVSSLPVSFTHRVVGADGGTLHGSDGTGLLRVSLRYNRRDLFCQLKLSFEPQDSVMPQVMMPVLRFIAQSRPGCSMELVCSGDEKGRVSAPITADIMPRGWEPDEIHLWADAFEDLAQLQSRTGQFFPIPDDFTKADVQQVKEILALLDGQKVVLRGDTVSVGVVSAEALDQLADTRSGMFRLTAGYEGMLFTLGQHQMDLGPCTETYTMDKILNMKEARRDIAALGHATAVLRLAKNFPAVRYLGSERPE